MKTKFNLIVLFVALTVSAQVLGQKKTKIEGNKVVTDVFRTLDEFNALEVSDNLVVTLTQTNDNGVHIRTDENLVDVIKFDILNGTLKIYSTHKITKNKELEINLTFKELSAIRLMNKAELVSKNRLEFERLDLSALDDSKYDLDIQSNESYFNLGGNSKGDLVLKGTGSKMILNDNAYLSGEILSDDFDLTVNKRADMNLKGDVTNLKLTATGSSDIKAKKLKSTYADLNASNSADIYVNITKELTLYTQGKSYVYVYGNPDIKVDGMNDKSRIIKK